MIVEGNLLAQLYLYTITFSVLIGVYSINNNIYIDYNLISYKTLVIIKNRQLKDEPQIQDSSFLIGNNSLYNIRTY